MTSRFVSEGGELQVSSAAQLELLEELTRHGAALRTEVRGASMSPFIQDRDVVTISPLGRREPQLGDVLAIGMQMPERLVIHRVVARAGAGLLTKGDNLRAPDAIVERDLVLGRVVRVERNGRDVDYVAGWRASLVAALSRADLLRHLVGLRRTLRRVFREER